MWMAVTLNSKWLPPNIKSWAPLTSVDFKVLPQHDLLVRRGHRYHCHSESSPPHCFCFPFRQHRPYPENLNTDTWLHFSAQQCIVLILSGEPYKCAKSRIWAQAWFPCSSSSSSSGRSNSYRPDKSSKHTMVHLWDQIFSAAPALSRSEGKLRQLTIPLHQWRVNAFCWSSESSFLLLMPRLWLFCWMSKSAHSAGGGGETLKGQFSQHPNAHFFFEEAVTTDANKACFSFILAHRRPGNRNTDKSIWL